MTYTFTVTRYDASGEVAERLELNNADRAFEAFKWLAANTDNTETVTLETDGQK